MSLLTWEILFAVSSLMWIWILFLGGADWLEGSFLSGFLVSIHAPLWSADEMKLFVVLIWIGEGIWFAIGLFVPEARFLWLYPR
jgi:hypothetical protein